MYAEKTITLIGATASPYTRKMLSLLRYRRIPYQIVWGEPTAVLEELGIPKPKISLLPTVILENNDGIAEAVCDSTPIIRRLEKLNNGRSVIPSDPALAFINYLLEDFADEWCTKYMFHYRWHFEQDADNAGTLLPLTMNVSLSNEDHAQFKQVFSQHQIGRLSYVGSNEVTAATIDASYRRLLTLLEQHFEKLPFLLGHRPSSSDFALFGQLSQLLGFDPTPMAIAHELSPRSVAWISVLEDLSGLENNETTWNTIEALPGSLTAILREVGRTYIPALLANAEAALAGKQHWQVEIDGCLWRQQTFPYQSKCLHWIREQYQLLSSPDQQRVNMLLADTGCDEILNKT
ncbi:MAG: glutathione S-transferase N-terminal domain-containing protein [Spongiibacteraceae bacterium]